MVSDVKTGVLYKMANKMRRSLNFHNAHSGNFLEKEKFRVKTKKNGGFINCNLIQKNYQE